MVLFLQTKSERREKTAGRNLFGRLFGRYLCRRLFWMLQAVLLPQDDVLPILLDRSAAH